MGGLMKLAVIVLAVSMAARGTAMAETITSDAPACAAKSDMERFVEIAQSGDNKAFHLFFAETMASGRCTVLPAGTKLHLSKTGSFLGAVRQYRPDGTTTAYWIGTSFVGD